MDFLLFNYWLLINFGLFVCLSYFRDQTRELFPWKSSFHWFSFFTKTTVTFSFIIAILIVLLVYIINMFSILNSIRWLRRASSNNWCSCIIFFDFQIIWIIFFLCDFNNTGEFQRRRSFSMAADFNSLMFAW